MEVFVQHRIVDCNFVNIRKDPSINSKVICVLKKGQTVQAVDGAEKTTTEVQVLTGKTVTIEWAKIKSNDNRFWVSKKYLEKVDTRATLMVKYAKEIGDYMVKNKWHYESGSFGVAKTWKKAKSCGKKQASCAAYVSWVAQIAGLLPSGKEISHTSAGHGKGMKSIKYAYNLLNCEITCPDKLAKYCTLKPGDILIYDSNICIYAGDGEFYDAGGPFSANCDKSKGGGNRFIAIPSAPNYDRTKNVLAVIRAK